MNMFMSFYNDELKNSTIAISNCTDKDGKTS